MHAGHGPNIGHGYVKYVIIDDAHGVQQRCFPALLAPARSAVSGGLASATPVQLGGLSYWVGSDALLSRSPLTILASDRLDDPIMIPALVAGAMQWFGALNGASTGGCVSGLPATWASDRSRAAALGARLREGYPGYASIRIIPEPLGMVYAALLNNDGALTGDPALEAGVIGVVDIGHHTVDVATIRQLVPAPAGLDTWQLGTARALAGIRSQLAAAFERELSLYEVDQAIRAGRLRVAGQDRPLPHGWDRPLLELSESIVARLQEAWGRGSQLDTILLGGGGAELPVLTAAIQRRFPHAVVVESPQLAIALGYARLARKYGREGGRA